MRVARLCSTVLLCVLTVTSAAVKRRRRENESSLPLIRDVIGLLSRFLDLSDLFPFSQVCRMFEDVATHSLTLRTGGLLRDNKCRNRLVYCKKSRDVYPTSKVYAAIDKQRTLIRFGNEHLLIRGVGLSAQPGYTGRMVVLRRVKVPISDEFKMTPDKDWIWRDQGWMMNLHNGRTIQFDRGILDFVPPYFVQIDDDEHPLLFRLDPQTMKITLVSHSKADIDYPYKDLYLIQSKLDRLPSLLILDTDEIKPDCGVLDFNDGREKMFDWPAPFDVDEPWYQAMNTTPKTVIVMSDENTVFEVLNPASERTLLRSLIPCQSVFGRCWRGAYTCSDNGRYALLSIPAAGDSVQDYVEELPHIFDLKSGEMIGPETNGDAWVSEEVFHVPKQTQFTVRSVHQPRENIACVMVDEGGNETPMMDEHFRILHKDNVLFDKRSDEILFVEWERD